MTIGFRVRIAGRGKGGQPPSGLRPFTPRDIYEQMKGPR
jgi:hypothetical protein